MDPLEELRVLDISSADFPSQIVEILRGKQYQGCIMGLQNDSLVWLVEFLDDVRPRILHSPFTQHQLGHEQARSNPSCVFGLLC